MCNDWSAQAILSAVHAHSFWQWRFPAANRATTHNEGLHNIAPRKVNCWNGWNPKIVDDARVKPFSRLPWCLDKLKDFGWHIHWICVSNNSLLIWLSIWGCAESRSMINSLSAKKTSHIYRSLEIHFEVSSPDFSGLARQWWAPYVAWLWLSFSSSYHDPTGTQWEGHSTPKRGSNGHDSRGSPGRSCPVNRVTRFTEQITTAACTVDVSVLLTSFTRPDTRDSKEIPWLSIGKLSTHGGLSKAINCSRFCEVVTFVVLTALSAG